MSTVTADSIIMGKVVEVISTKDSSIRGIYNAIIPAIPCIIVMVAVKKCLENFSEIFYSVTSAVKNILYKLFYREKVIESINDVENCNHYLSARYHNKSQAMLKSFIPVYWSTSADGNFGYLSYFPFYHSEEINWCETAAQKDFEEHKDLVNLKETIYKKYSKLGSSLGYVKSNASSLYPSKNYIKLVDIISTHFEVSEKVGVYSVIGMLIDGIQGLGKTKFADFAAKHKIAGHVYKIDMTNFLEYDFKTISSKFYHGIDITTNTIFLIDEIDKYLTYRVKIEYDKHIEIRNKKDDMAEGKERIHKSFKEFTEDMKTTFLYDMLSILERDGLIKSIVVIFCSNNFHTIFDGVDLTHHKSLYDRFMKIPFKLCDHDEIIGYIMHYNQKFTGSKYYCSVAEEELSFRLKSNVKVTNRTLHQISIQFQYDPIKMIDALNNYEPDDLEVLLNRSPTLTPPTELIVNPGISENKETSYILPNNTPICSDKCEKNVIADEENNKSDIFEIEQLEHERLWANYASITKQIDPNTQKKILSKMKYLLQEIQGTEDLFEKKILLVNFFDYLQSEGPSLVVYHPTFKQVVIDKIKEFHQTNSEIFPELNEKTKEFVYAVSGILC